MQLLLRYLFTTAEGLGILALFTFTPIAFTLLSIKNIKPIHLKIYAVLALVLAVPAAISLFLIQPGSGMGGLVFILAGVGFGSLAWAFLVATIATSAVLALRGDIHSPKRLRKSPINPRRPSSPPLLREFARWKTDSRRPRATYQEFIEEAHHRYFPASRGLLIAAAIVMAVVFFLALR